MNTKPIMYIEHNYREMLLEILDQKKEFPFNIDEFLDIATIFDIYYQILASKDELWKIYQNDYNFTKENLSLSEEVDEYIKSLYSDYIVDNRFSKKSDFQKNKFLKHLCGSRSMIKPSCSMFIVYIAKLILQQRWIILCRKIWHPFIRLIR